MANKKRRKANRSRAHQASRSNVKTAEREPTAPDTDERDASRPRVQGGSSAAASRGRAERKELARRQREEVRRRIRRAQRLRRLATIAAVAGVVGAGVFFFTRSSEPTPTGRLPGLLTSEAPWPANAEQAADRADAIGLPFHGSQLAMHNHANVQVYVNGARQPVPNDIGINQADVASIHTHTADGVVHVESSTVADFTIGQFFDIWGVRLTASCLGGHCNGADGQIRVFVDGEPAPSNPREVPLDDRTVVVVTYGTEQELPDPIPSTFDFASIAP